MASKSTNRVTEALKARHQAETRAVDAAAAAEAAANAAAGRRAAALERLDADVAQAAQAHDIAVTAVAALMTEDVAASVLGADLVDIRAARRRAPVDEVQAAVQTLTAHAPQARRPDRPRRGRPPAAKAARAGGAGGVAVVAGDGADPTVAVADDSVPVWSGPDVSIGGGNGLSSV
jgi:hypothetical protein